MSIFSSLISALSTSSDLEELLAGSSVENVRLEFKRDVPAKDETLKKLSSFANTFGGYLVVGAEAGSEGRLTGLPSVDVQPGYKQTIMQWCFAGAAPPLTAEVSDPIPASGIDGRVCYVIRVAESDLAPHFLNARKGVYVRTDEFSSRFEPRLATEHELRHLLDRRREVRSRRASIITRARQRFHTFTQTQSSDESTHARTVGARIDLTIVPRFPSHPICAQGQLLSTMREHTVGWRRRPRHEDGQHHGFHLTLQVSKYYLHLHPHAADAAVGEIVVQKAGRGRAEHAPFRNLGELRMVQDVEGFPPKLQPPLLSDLEGLGKSHVKVVDTARENCVPAHCESIG